ncbi:MAG: hypothetical protein ACK4VX_13375 [Polaromonas sp.]
MSETQVPQDLRTFILMSVGSVPYLEAMLLLRREPELPWDARRLARRLYVADKKSEELLQALLDAGIVVPTEDGSADFCYRPRTPELAAMVDRLAAFYASNLVDVTHLIHATHERKAEKFANAFIWRKKPDA